MDGINGKSKESQLYVIGATNKPRSGGRFSAQVPKEDSCYTARQWVKDEPFPAVYNAAEC